MGCIRNTADPAIRFQGNSMLRSFGLVLLALILSSFTPLYAETFKQSDLVSFSGGYLNFKNSDSHRQAGDFL